MRPEIAHRHSRIGNGTSYQAPAVQKAFRLLERVASAEDGLRLAEISQALGLSKSTTHGLIQALVAVGALDQTPLRKKFFLGPSIMDLAFKSRNYFAMSTEVRPILERLRNRINETIFLGVLSDSRGIILAAARASKTLTISSSPGDTIPLLAGAVGKAYLASLSETQALAVIQEKGLRKYTSASIVDETAYLREVARVRRDGFALDNEEYLAGVKALAIYLGLHRGLPLLVWVVGFTDSMSKERMPQIIHETLAAAEELKSVMDRGS